MKPLLMLTKTEFRLYMREPAALFFTLVFPLMLLVIFGSVFGNDPADGFNDQGAMDIAVPGYGGMIIGTTAFMSIPIVISQYRQNGIFRRMRATPVKPYAIIISQMIVNLALTLAGLALLYIGGKILYDLKTPELPGVLLGTILIGFLSLASVGFLIGSLAGTSRTASVIGNIVYFPQLFLSGAALPREMFSDSLRKWTEFLPMTQLNNAMKDAWLYRETNLTSLAILAAIGITAAVISARVFSWD